MGHGTTNRMHLSVSLAVLLCLGALGGGIFLVVDAFRLRRVQAEQLEPPGPPVRGEALVASNWMASLLVGTQLLVVAVACGALGVPLLYLQLRPPVTDTKK